MPLCATPASPFLIHYGHHEFSFCMEGNILEFYYIGFKKLYAVCVTVNLQVPLQFTTVRMSLYDSLRLYWREKNHILG